LTKEKIKKLLDIPAEKNAQGHSDFSLRPTAFFITRNHRKAVRHIQFVICHTV